ncbi:hypothetical protein MUA03_13145 [Enterobacteriaceae bacterium H16N7]|nr:hypothetical protein [Dryocola clanedunensis]
MKYYYEDEVLSYQKELEEESMMYSNKLTPETNIVHAESTETYLREKQAKENKNEKK